jgi:hypothetical protein
VATAQEKSLAGIWLAVMVIETGDAIAKSKATSKNPNHRRLPPPSRYFATMVVYLMLAGAAAVSQTAGRVAVALGGLVGLTILLAPPTLKKPIGPTNEPPIVAFFGYLTSLYGGVSLTPPKVAAITAPTPNKPHVFPTGTKTTPTKKATIVPITLATATKPSTAYRTPATTPTGHGYIGR